ncbi:DUF6480 family protein [Streptomyces sp. NPDC005480]|uniref:DUF6480 family protein n=1 Tax=Streptomyces sp. NPDC005480 TaxID=3154880 RepID=UPI0033AB69FF
MRSAKTAASRSSLRGKWRKRVAIPTPASRATEWPGPGAQTERRDTPRGNPSRRGGTSGISYPEPELRKGWGPMPLALIMLVVALVAVGLIAMAVVLLV